MEYECAEERIDGRRVARQWPGADAPGWYRGGKSQDGTRQFDEKRPGWEEPVHQLMVDNGVTIFERKEKTLRVCLTLETKLALFNANGELVLEREIEEFGNTPRLIADDNGGMYLFGTSALSSDRTIGVWIARVLPSAYDIIARRDGRVITCDTTAQLPPISTLPLNAAPDLRVRIARLDADLKKLRDKPFFGRAMPGAATLTGPAPYDCSVPTEDIG
jgi:hypothetical protein